MTQDDIIRMAREAGLCTWVVPPQGAVEQLVHFAALVAAAEREACAGSDAPCRYPDCVDNGPEGKCMRWLLAECEKSEDYRGGRKQWQNLTDDEIKKILGPLGSWGPTPIKGYTRKLFDEIEAALKEKNA